MFIGAAGRSLVSTLKPRLKKYTGGDLLHNGVLFDHDECFIFSTEADSKQAGSKKKPVCIDGDVYAVDQEKGVFSAAQIYDLYAESEERLWPRINGDFSAALWQNSHKRLVLARDRIGAGNLFVWRRGDDIAFSSSLRDLVVLLEKQGDLNYSTLLRYLTFCYNPSAETFFTGIRRLEPAHVLVWKPGSMVDQQYWDLNFENSEKHEAAVAEAVRNKLAQAVHLRQDTEQPAGAFLSGGLDSSTVVSLLRRGTSEPISTFSFRCRGQSFDESEYAKIVADAFGTDHHLVEYTPESVLKAGEMTRLMHEPFSDVGINIGTFILASKAREGAKYLFTGDGGDELFAGHPVYVADKGAALFSRIPGLLLKPVFSLGRRLHDSDRKKDFRVKYKRFSESYFFPEELGTHRWRVYYHHDRLQNTVTSQVLDAGNFDSIFSYVIDINRRARAEDALGASLYSDYQTVVQFYLRRMDMARSFGLRPRMPMLDPDVVSYCSKVSSNLKIKGFSDTKYIERVAVMPLLPYEITHRSDKLGHSVPLKNWMRDNETVRSFMQDVLSKETLSARNLVQPDAVQVMYEEHMERQFNHSHRLWALVVLELWLQAVEKYWNKIGADV